MAENFRINITLESIEFNFMFADYGLGVVVVIVVVVAIEVGFVVELVLTVDVK
jgi:hypothetical protein